MLDFTFHNCQYFKSAFLEIGSVYLWIFNPTKFPPHIGISTEQKYYSLKMNGKDEAIDTSTLFDFCEREAKKLIVQEVKISISEEKIANAFAKFQNVIPGENSCLAPINQLFNLPKSTILKDLLDNLDNNKRLNRVFQLNLSNDVQLVTYTAQELHEKLSKTNV